LIMTKGWSWRLLLLVGLLAYAAFIGIALVQGNCLSPYLTFLAALAVSVAVIISLVLKARDEIQDMIKKPFGPPTDFWLYGSITGKSRYVLAVAVPLIITALEYLMFSRTTYFSLSATTMLCISAMLGLGLPPYVYGRFRVLVENMQNKLDSAEEGYAEKRAAMTIYARAAGGSSTCQAVTVLAAFGAYAIFALLDFLFQGLFVFRPLPMLVSIIIAGIVGAMTTTISGFVVYCRNVFAGGRHFDVMDSDGQGGFGALGTIALSSSSMLAVVAGLGVPVSFFGPGPVTAYEFGLTIFTAFVVALNFATPIISAHSVIASSKKKSLDDLGSQYRAALHTLDHIQKVSPPNDQLKLLQVLYLESVFDRVLKVQEWPSVFTLIWGATNTLIPFLVELIGRRLNIF
jgi:hypothetical protein